MERADLLRPCPTELLYFGPLRLPKGEPTPSMRRVQRVYDNLRTHLLTNPSATAVVRWPAKLSPFHRWSLLATVDGPQVICQEDISTSPDTTVFNKRALREFPTLESMVDPLVRVRPVTAVSLGSNPCPPWRRE